jgi:hypothetical protein
MYLRYPVEVERKWMGERDEANNGMPTCNSYNIV